jgi:PAS domain S-box-containing protein
MERRVVGLAAPPNRFGYSAEEALGQRTILVPPEGMAESHGLFERCINGDTVRDYEVKRRRKDGTIVDIRLAATPMYNPDGAVWGVAWAYDDIGDRKKADAKLRHLAHNDQLTGLPNRVALQNELTRLISEVDNPSVSIAMFDLDGVYHEDLDSAKVERILGGLK